MSKYAALFEHSKHSTLVFVFMYLCHVTCTQFTYIKYTIPLSRCECACMCASHGCENLYAYIL